MEIDDIYRQRRSEFVSREPLLVQLEDQCRPPNWCRCYILRDPSHSGEIAQDLGRWHYPKSFMFPNSLPIEFNLVDMKRIDSDTYSVLACPY
jgi:hypothetical protein